jgi:hypothetical protein
MVKLGTRAGGFVQIDTTVASDEVKKDTKVNINTFN